MLLYREFVDQDTSYGSQWGRVGASVAMVARSRLRRLRGGWSSSKNSRDRESTTFVGDDGNLVWPFRDGSTFCEPGRIAP